MLEAKLGLMPLYGMFLCQTFWTSKINLLLHYSSAGKSGIVDEKYFDDEVLAAKAEIFYLSFEKLNNFQKFLF